MCYWIFCWLLVFSSLQRWSVRSSYLQIGVASNLPLLGPMQQICLRAMVGPFTIERAHIQRIATHAISPQLQHCYALLATILPLIFPEFRFFFSWCYWCYWWYCDVYSPSYYSGVRFFFYFLRFPHSDDIWWMFFSWSTCLSTTVLRAMMPYCHCIFSPDYRFFQLVLYCALCLSSGEWGFHPVHTTRFPHSQCRRHLRMWSV